MKNNTQLLFVAVLVFVFPILFVAISQDFYTNANTNITTAEKRRVGMLHDSLAAIVREPAYEGVTIEPLLASFADDNPDIRDIRIVNETSEGFVVMTAVNGERIGTLDPNQSIYQGAFGGNDTFIYEDVSQGYREWFAVRKVAVPDQPARYIYSEHSLQGIDTLMAARRQQSYFGLSAIFIFLIALAYWISRQISWQQKYKGLQQQLAERDLFSSMITHEFRSPLTAINGYLSFLKEAKGLTPEEQRYVQTIETASGRLLALVNDFLEVARIQSGKMTIERTPTLIHETINKVLDVVRPMAELKGLELRFSPALQPITLLTDEKRLSQVLQNMITNSIKYTESGSVEVVTEINPVTCTIRIKDTGMGISAEDQPKLFAPFARVGGVEKTGTVGTGLGMWITRQIVELLGGTIGIESIKGVGTHAVITFKTK